MLVRLSRANVDAYIIEAAGVAVGYLQVWLSEQADECGIDMFLVPEARGRGSARTPHEQLSPIFSGSQGVRGLRSTRTCGTIVPCGHGARPAVARSRHAIRTTSTHIHGC
jgi:hypothetical protein